MRIVALVILALGLPLGAVSARPQAAAAPPFAVVQRSVANGVYPMDVEQQRFYGPPMESVNNVTQCLWDTDDRLVAQFYGRVGGGETVSYSDCVIEDWAAHWVKISGDTRLEPTLTVDGVAVPLTANGCWKTTDHGVALDADGRRVGDPPLPEIAGSNGGEGVRIELVWSFRNPRNGPLNNAFASAQVAHSSSPGIGCP